MQAGELIPCIDCKLRPENGGRIITDGITLTEAQFSEGLHYQTIGRCGLSFSNVDETSLTKAIDGLESEFKSCKGPKQEQKQRSRTGVSRLIYGPIEQYTDTSCSVITDELLKALIKQNSTVFGEEF